MADKDPCALLKGTPGYDYCRGDSSGSSSPGSSSGLTGGASDHVKELANSLIATLKRLLVPEHAWAPQTADSAVYGPFMWLGQHLAVTIFVCVVVVCGLTAWQGAPRMRQMGASTGWTLAAVAGMAAVPGAVSLLNRSMSAAFTAAFDSNEGTLFSVIRGDMAHGADSANPLAKLLILSALVVALAFAALVFMVRQLGIVVFVCMAPLVLASLARGGDSSAVWAWAQRLLGLMGAPFALLIVSPFVELVQGSLVMDAVLLVAADALMLRMIFHGVPYFGPRVARAARTLVERHTDNPIARGVVRVGVPDVYEQENGPRRIRTVPTPGRAMHQDRGVLLAAYGIQQPDRSGRLTTASAVDQARRDTTESIERRRRIAQARRESQGTGQQPARPAAPPAAPPVPPAPGPAPTPPAP
ncbi:hypothetical protein [Streptomyces sp. NPDC001068]|uniref:hypothetical protein n=1 Tax=Streptomyces sp. NPDC001068 TaxID=3364544 RepID=UPI003680D1CC